jgi:hypothetical protein
MDGIFIKGRRPKSKKEVKAAVAEDPASVEVEFTSLMRKGPSCQRVSELDTGTISFVGPDPYTARKFYGNLRVARFGDELKVTVS